MRIAIVEDEQKLRATLQEGLEAEGYLVDGFSRGEELERELLKSRVRYGVILLDLMLPGKSGAEVCRDVRMRDIATPILVLTARTAVTDKVELLDAGADDFVTKPFAFDELLARIRAVTRRPPELKRKNMSIRDLTLDMNTQTVTRGGKSLPLTSTEFDLLRLLLERRGQVISRERISEYLWDEETVTVGNAVDVHMSNLRKKLSTDDEKEIIQTVRGVGYLVQK